MMLKKLNHVAIAVPSLDEAVESYKEVFKANISNKIELPKHGVSTIFISLPNTNIELLEPLGHNSPIAKFLKKNTVGGIHHICYEVEDVYDSAKKLKEKGFSILGDGIPREGAHGKPVIVLHPKEFNGTLIELEQS